MQALIKKWVKVCTQSNAGAAIVDLRGRGGVEKGRRLVCEAVSTLQEAYGIPVVALTSKETRSQQERIAHELRSRFSVPIVGAASAGAVIPMSLAKVCFGGILMYPNWGFGGATGIQDQGNGLAPDVIVDDAKFDGGDPILARGLAIAATLARIPPARRVTSTEAARLPLPTVPGWSLLREQWEQSHAAWKVLRGYTLTGSIMTTGEPGEGSYRLEIDRGTGFVENIQIGDYKHQLEVPLSAAPMMANKDGNIPITGAGVNIAKVMAAFDGPFADGLFDGAPAIDVCHHNGAGCFRLRATIDGARFTFLLDTDSLRIRAMSWTESWLVGQMTVSRNFLDYQEHAPGIWLPMTIEFDTPAMTRRYMILRVEIASASGLPSS